eukprot:1966-Heterococcus_DN1.PRE.1
MTAAFFNRTTTATLSIERISRLQMDLETAGESLLAYFKLLHLIYAPTVRTTVSSTSMMCYEALAAANEAIAASRVRESAALAKCAAAAAAAAAAAIVAEKGEFYKKETAKLRRDLVDLEVAVNKYVLELDIIEHVELQLLYSTNKAFHALPLIAGTACYAKSETAAALVSEQKRAREILELKAQIAKLEADSDAAAGRE